MDCVTDCPPEAKRPSESSGPMGSTFDGDDRLLALPFKRSKMTSSSDLKTSDPFCKLSSLRQVKLVGNSTDDPFRGAIVNIPAPVAFSHHRDRT